MICIFFAMDLKFIITENIRFSFRLSKQIEFIEYCRSELASVRIHQKTNK